MVRMKDSAVYAQLSKPDMRLPIHKALYWSGRIFNHGVHGVSRRRRIFRIKTPCNSVSSVVNSSDFGRLDFDSLTLTFYQPDTEKFPLLALAYEAVKKGALYPCAYNGANEAAVGAFLAGRVGFLDISRVTRYVLDKDWSAEPTDIAAVLEADRQARITAEKEIEGIKC